MKGRFLPQALEDKEAPQHPHCLRYTEHHALLGPTCRRQPQPLRAIETACSSQLRCNRSQINISNWLCLPGRVGGGGRTVRAFGMDMYTLLYLKWITNKDLLSSTGNAAQRAVPAWKGGGFGENACICLAESLCCPPETTTTLLPGCIPIQDVFWCSKLINKSLVGSRNQKNATNSCSNSRGVCSDISQHPLKDKVGHPWRRVVY